MTKIRVLAGLILLTGCTAGEGEPAVDPAESVAFDRVFEEIGPSFELRAPADDPIGTMDDLVPWAGGLAVVDRIASNVKVFELDGSHRLTMGNPGDGPHEFRGPVRAAHILDGRLAVLDGRGRVVLFDSTGEATGQWEMNGGPFNGIAVAPASGDLVVAARLFDDPKMLASVPMPMGIHRFGPDGEFRGTLPEPADTLSGIEYSVAMRKMALVGDVVVTGLQSRNVMTHQDLTTLERRTFEAGASFWEPIDWSDPALSPATMAEWMRHRIWFVDPEPVDSARYVAMFRVPDQDGNEFRLRYVLMDLDGRELAVTEPSRQSLFGSREGTLYAADPNESGDYVVTPLRLKSDLAD